MPVIQWVRTNKAGAAKYSLILRLGDRGGRAVYLECSKVPPRETAILRAWLPALAKLSFPERLAWLKRACPTSYRLAYREIATGNLEVLRTY